MSEQLGSFLDRMRPALGAIDVRTAVASQKGSREHLLTVIRFSQLSRENVEERFRELERRWGKVDRERLKISSSALPLSDWDGIVSDLQEGRLRVADDYVTVTQQNPLEVGCILSTYTNYTPKGDWPVAEALCQSKHKLSLDSFSGEAIAQGFPDIRSMLRSWFGLTSNYQFENDMLIVVPALARIVHCDLDSIGRVEATARFHQALDSLMLTVSILGSDAREVADLHRVQLVREKSQIVDEDFIEFTFNSELAVVNPDNYLDVRVVHTNPTGLDLHQVRRPISEYLTKRNPAENAFARAFDRFSPLKDLRFHLKDPSSVRTRPRLPPEDVFERAVAWLLSLSGLSVSRLEEYEKLRSVDGTVQLDSVDILAWDKQLRILFLVACTIGLPKLEEDAVMIKETRRKVFQALFEDTTVRLVPVIFSSMGELGPVKEKATAYGVSIIDSAGSETMLDLVGRGKQAEAVQVLIEPVRGIL